MDFDPTAAIDEPVVDVHTMTDRELLIRMDGKITTAFTSLFQAHSTSEKKTEDHETRIRALEKFRWYLAGVAAVVGILGARFAEAIFPAN